MTIDEARRVLHEAASGLTAVHRTRVIHRDIKPGNSMLEGPARRFDSIDSFGRAISDFGAKPRSPAP